VNPAGAGYEAARKKSPVFGAAGQVAPPGFLPAETRR